MQQKIKYRFFLMAATFFVAFNGLIAQDTNLVKKPVYLHASFYYDFSKSFGASAGIDFPFSSKLKISYKKDSTKNIQYRDWIINADIGFYRYEFNNTGVFFIPSFGKRYSGEKSYYFEWLAGAGLLRTFYDGAVYSVDDNGKVQEENNFGRWYATANFAAVFGWDLSKTKRPKPVALQLKPMLWFQFPYNSFLLPHLSFEAGFKYHFKNFNAKVPQYPVK